MSTGVFDPLRGQLLDAARAFGGDSGEDGVARLLAALVDDVDRALAEELEIFPVCHHSPASALAMARRLREKRPKVVYLEMCEDFAPLLAELKNCRLPVALQSFANELDGFPKKWAPLSVVAPITEASAEYQAIAYAQETAGVELVLVDRSTDHVYQWDLRDEDASGAEANAVPDAVPAPSGGVGADDEDALHGDAVGVEIGDLRPGFAELEEHLLHHGKVRHWSEWWDQYVEQPLTGADYATYRQVMTLIGSLFRRLDPHSRNLRRNELRERHMWTRMREHIAATGADPADCLYVCGASHAVSRVDEFGLHPEKRDGPDGSAEPFEIAPRTATKWRYGLIPSSHSAIEAQFGLASGSVSIAAATFAKAVKRGGVKPFRLKGQRGVSAAGKKKAAAAPPVDAAATDRLSGFLSSPPALDPLDESELLGWCVDIVGLARRNGYLASTADAIAVFETSILLAGMRGRTRPTPYDFQDAAVTCIEKDRVPGRRDVTRLCEILLGGDRVGQVGYESLPPLARDVLDRLEPLGLDLQKRTVQRALLNLDADPDLRSCSDLLWVLRRLLPDDAVRPIMGARELGERSIQESWDLAIGRNQRSLVELGYEGVTAEQVLERRLRRAVYDPKATAAAALRAVEDAVVYLGAQRFADELGARAVELLAAERTVDDAPEVLRRIRRLLAHYRATEPELPHWCREFVTAGYTHYCTLLPTAFVDDDTGVRQVAAMLGFLLGMESLALSLGCERAQLELAVRQSHPESPAKIALLWAAKSQLGMMPLADVRARCDELLASPLSIPSFPHYLSGFVQALDPAPSLAPLVVEVLSKAFGRLPDRMLLPWLPKLITTLKDHAREMVPVLVHEAARTFPGSLPALDAWTPSWSESAEAPGVGGAAPSVASGPVTDLLAGQPGACDAVASLLGHPVEWRPAAGTGEGGGEASALVARHPAAPGAVAALRVR
ncbi:hypothetical protein BJF79_33710 [Actinomadura sp. CNU-125]|uniref:hypothetical protein n=1 Tax=Actinomadura sp. CNU-125 TaxID=1904961 RepID=UPI000961B7FE|nr:hypothetical protein [Actinomadura sp. CNU-125]OLT34135.1 hypothetical protein BJF79_33710 [Actinomadura sp. CNU-125]